MNTPYPVASLAFVKALFERLGALTPFAYSPESWKQAKSTALELAASGELERGARLSRGGRGHLLTGPQTEALLATLAAQELVEAVLGALALAPEFSIKGRPLALLDEADRVVIFLATTPFELGLLEQGKALEDLWAGLTFMHDGSVHLQACDRSGRIDEALLDFDEDQAADDPAQAFRNLLKGATDLAKGFFERAEDDWLAQQLVSQDGAEDELA